MAVTFVLVLFLAVLQSVAYARVPLPPFVQNNGEGKFRSIISSNLDFKNHKSACYAKNVY